jgi:hypothetical protein
MGARRRVSLPPKVASLLMITSHASVLFTGRSIWIPDASVNGCIFL